MRNQDSPLLENLTETDRLKRNFLALMSHEIRTPLNTVIGFAELLKEESLDFLERKEYAEYISAASHSLLNLINDILDLSQLNSDTMVIQEQECDFNKVCFDIAAFFSGKVREKDLKEIIDISPMPTLYIDKIRLRQVLFNLMGNALKFTNEGFVKLKADFMRDDNSTGTLIFYVQDSGIGIPAEEHPIIFDIFTKTKSSCEIYGGNNNGTGSGLAICKQMLNIMGGTISFESEPSKGSKFTVKIENVRYSELKKPENDLLTVSEPSV